MRCCVAGSLRACTSFQFPGSRHGEVLSLGAVPVLLLLRGTDCVDELEWGVCRAGTTKKGRHTRLGQKGKALNNPEVSVL